MPVDGVGCSVATSARAGRSSSCTAGLSSTTRYFLPELDRLADRSASSTTTSAAVAGRPAASGPRTSALRSEIDDLERVRSHFGLESVAVLGHSWGGVLAMEYAIRHPDRVSQLILMDTAPASAGDWRSCARSSPAARSGRARGDGGDRRHRGVRRGDLEAEAAYNRAHFRMTVRRPELPRGLVARLRANGTERERPPRARSTSACDENRPFGELGSVPRAATARRPHVGAARRARLHPGRAGCADRGGHPGRAPLGAARVRSLHLPRGA